MKPFKRPAIVAAAIALVLTASFGAANAGPLLWIADRDNTLATVDVAGGAPTVKGQMGATTADPITDIAFDPLGKLWGITSSQLFTIDKTTAARTLVGNLGATLNSLVFGSDGTLYAAGTSLYTINTSTGAATSIGNGGTTYTSSGDLAFVSNTLYLSVDPVSGSNDRLFRIDKTTGAGTLVGTLGQIDVFGLAADGGTLYGASYNKIYTVNTSTAAMTYVRDWTAAAGLGFGYVNGSAFYSEAGAGTTVPEPATVALLGLGLAGFAVTRRRKQ